MNRPLVNIYTAIALLFVRLARRRNDMPRRRAVRDLYRLHHLNEFAYRRPARRPF